MTAISARWRRWIPVLIVVVAILSYANSFSGPFIFDDNRIIVDDPHLGELWPITIKSRIVTLLSFRLNYAVSGMNYADYHVVNLAIHILSALLLLGVVRRTLTLPVLAERYGRHASCLSLLIALLWTVHPLQTESVTYICQRFEAMMGLFFLLALYAFIRGWGGASRRWTVVSIVACILGMGTKEIMVTFPIVALLYDYIFFARGSRAALARRWKVHLSLFATWGVYLGLSAWEMAAGKMHATGTVFVIPIHRYLFTQFGVILHYLRLSIVPHPLCLDYAWLPAEGIVEILLPGLVVGTLGLITVWGLWRQRPVAFLGVWFFVILAPTSSIMPIADLAFEHRMYLPLAAVIALVVLAGYELSMRLSGRLKREVSCCFLAAVLGLVAVVFAGLTYQRNKDYQSERVMWRDVVEKREHNYRAAIALISSLLDNGQVDQAEALARDLVERMEAVKKQKTSGVLRSRVDSCYHSALNQLGRALFAGRDLDGARQFFHKAIQARPGYAMAWYNLSLIDAALGNAANALQRVEKALEIDPGYITGHRLRGLLLARLERYREAVASYHRALEMMPRDTATRLQLSWLLATCPQEGVRDGDEALRLSRQVLNETGQASGHAWDVFGAALAETGAFDAAVSAAEEAISIYAVREAPDLEKLQAIRKRLVLYREGRAYREEAY